MQSVECSTSIPAWARPVMCALCCLVTILLLGAGCPLPSEYWVPSAELRYVLSHQEQFAQTDELRTAGLAPGTVRDDLAGLSGCFGAYSIWNAPFLSVPNAEVYVFDATTGEMQYMVWQAGLVAGHDAAFETLGNDHIVVTRQIDGEAQAVEALVTLDGDEMRIAYNAADGNDLDGELGEPDDPRVAMVFRRFVCP